MLGDEYQDRGILRQLKKEGFQGLWAARRYANHNDADTWFLFALYFDRWGKGGIGFSLSFFKDPIDFGD